MNDNIILDEYNEKLSYLKSFFLGEKISITNKQFYFVLKNIFEKKYNNQNMNLKDISDKTNVDEYYIEKIYSNLLNGNEINYFDFDFFSKLVNISDKTEEERLEIAERLLDSQEENAKLITKFKPCDILSEKGIQELEKLINKTLFNDKIQPLLNELETTLNPIFVSSYEKIVIADEYKEKYKKEDWIQPIFTPKIYFVKEEGEFIKLYDPDSLMPIFKNNTKISKKMVSRIPIGDGIKL